MAASRPSSAPFLGALGTIGTALGLLQLLPALPVGWQAGAEVLATLRLLAALGALSLLYALWRALPSLWAALLGGLLAGLGYFGVALHWLGSSANPDPATFVPREAVMEAGALVLFVPWWGLWLAAAHGLARLARAPEARPVAFVATFAAADVLLGDLAMGLPMAPLSLLALDTPLARLVPVLGQFGTDAALVLAAVALGPIVPLGTCPGGTAARRAARLAGAGLGLASLAWAVGRDPLAADAAGIAGRDAGAPLVHVVQPSLPHVSTLPPDEALGIVHGALEAAIVEAAAAGARLIVLPEGAVLADLTVNAEFVAGIGGLLPPETVVVAGFHRAAVSMGEGGSFTVQAFNSVALIGEAGLIRVIDKAHLVPWGEAVPRVAQIVGFDAIAAPSGGFTPGDALVVTSDVPGLPPFAVLICYEAMLPGAVQREAGGAGWLLNVSSETAFRGTAGPRLLLDHARLRALETGLPMLRATAHAFSGLIGPDGQVREVLAPEVAGGLTLAVPQARPTPFRRWGHTPLYGAILAALGALAVLRVLRPVRPDAALPVEATPCPTPPDEAGTMPTGATARSCERRVNFLTYGGPS